MNIDHQKVTLKMLRYFYQVSKTQNFSRAAEQLNITKSPLSTQIKELEHLLGVELFVRNTRHVELTIAGKQLANECQTIFDVVSHALDRVQQQHRNDSQTLNIGLMSSIFWAGFGDALHSLQTDFPAAQFNLIEMSPHQQKQALIDGKIELGLVRYADTINADSLITVPLFAEEMVVAVPFEHVLAKQSAISLATLQKERFVMLSKDNSASTQWIIEHCQQAGFYPDIVQQVIEPNTLLAVISTRKVLSIVPKSYAAMAWPHVHFIPLQEQIPADICALTYQAETPLINQCLQHLKRSFT